MFNLLPNSLKEKIRSEYHLRFFIIVLVSVIALQIIFLILVSPSWVMSLNKKEEVVSQKKESDNASLDQKILETSSRIKSINSKLSIINSSLEYSIVTPLINDILSKKTADIYIKDFIYTLSNKNTSTLALAGTSATREALVLFVKKLESSKFFKKVDLPISNFTKDKNLTFSINITIASQ